MGSCASGNERGNDYFVFYVNFTYTCTGLYEHSHVEVSIKFAVCFCAVRVNIFVNIISHTAQFY